MRAPTTCARQCSCSKRATDSTRHGPDPDAEVSAIRAREARRVSLLLRVIGLSALIGALFGGAGGVGFRAAPLTGAMLGGVGGLLNGVMLIGPVAAAEIFLPPTRLGHALERAPFLVARLVGDRTLPNIAFGRYHRPRTEERFFLFVDIAGSTPLAERIGPEAVHRFLGEVFRLASDPIDEYDGDVYQYVGDEVVVTWTVADGRDHARPLACFFAIEQALAHAARDFDREFGAVPRLRAALHAGPVITGEVGGSRRAIVYHGDVMNTTSRIEQATRDLERKFLVSGDALARLTDLGDFALDDLGLQQLRGRAAPVRIYAVTAKPSPNARTTTTPCQG